MPARVRRHLTHLDACEVFAQGLDPLGSMAGEILGRERFGGGPGDAPLVEAGEILEDVAELGLHEVPLGEEDPLGLGIDGEQLA